MWYVQKYTHQLLHHAVLVSASEVTHHSLKCVVPTAYMRVCMSHCLARTVATDLYLEELSHLQQYAFGKLVCRLITYAGLRTHGNGYKVDS